MDILEITGDDLVQATNDKLDRARIIVATPEKFDSITRRSSKTGKMGWVGDVGLVMIDEVHILGSSRGPTLESCIARLKLAQMDPTVTGGRPIASLRFVAISATIPNASSIAHWLGVSPSHLLVFGDESRSTELTTHVLGYPPSKNEYLFDLKLADHVLEVITKYSTVRGENCTIK